LKLDKTHNCLCCGKSLNGATESKGEDVSPSPGDISICMYCTTIARFNKDLQLEELTPQEFSELPQEVKDHLKNARDMLIDFNIKREFKK